MANQWFRLYHEFATDPKVQMMSEIDQRRLIMIFCMRCCNNSVTLQDSEVTFQLRISNEEWLKTKSKFIEKGFMDEGGKVLNWDKRQFASDSSRARVAAYRERVKNKVKSKGVTCNVTVTPPEQNRTEQSKRKINKKKSRTFQVPTVEIIKNYANEKSLAVDPEEFYNFYESKGWMVGKNKMKNWKSAIRGWNLRNKKNVVGYNQHAKNQRPDNSAPARVKRAIAERKRKEMQQRQQKERVINP